MLQCYLNWGVEEPEDTYFKKDIKITLGGLGKNKNKPENTGKLFLGNTNLQLTKATSVWTCERTAALLGFTLTPRQTLGASIMTQEALQITYILDHRC